MVTQDYVTFLWRVLYLFKRNLTWLQSGSQLKLFAVYFIYVRLRVWSDIGVEFIQWIWGFHCLDFLFGVSPQFLLRLVVLDSFPFPMARNMTHLKKILTTLCSIMIGSAQGSSVFRWISNSISPSQVIRLYFSHLFKIYNDICKRRSCLVHDSWDLCVFLSKVL